jgi:hypothetical protein
VPSPYRPPWFLTSGHAQTLWASVVRRVPFRYHRRTRLDTPDGDFLDLDWAFAAGPGAPARGAFARRLAVIAHGLEGSADAAYMRGMARALTRRGWDAVSWNLRGCSGEPNRFPRSYHSGATHDLNAVVTHLADAHPAPALALLGFSLGGNLTLRYLGERGADLDPRIRRAACFSVPVDLADTAATLARLHNWIYTRYFLLKLARKVRMKHRQFPNDVPAAPLAHIRTLEAFDDAYTAPLHGFDGAQDYYRRASCGPVLDQVAVPTLLVTARDDPFFGDASYPFDLARTHAPLRFEAPEHGGHVGFVRFGADGAYWSERRAAAFLDDVGR